MWKHRHLAKSTSLQADELLIFVFGARATRTQTLNAVVDAMVVARVALLGLLLGLFAGAHELATGFREK